MKPPPNREVALFSAALELPASQRAAYLEENCADDPALRLRLEALLRVHEEAIPFLESPPPGAQASPVGAEPAGATARLSGSPAEKAGDRIGRYKLLQQIGEGGCGVVYMAEQEEPVRRRVALKVIKLGMDTKQVIARFEAERQALALMDHPNIAKVLDAGATETGRPYFVMELVRGIKITDYCDQNHISTEERLKLFMQVCQAVQHAHQKGIIHRDIKPSNILVTVTEPGGPGCPKVIDFGIAKATTGQHLTDKTVFTAFEQFIGTPAYMSPEQAQMTSLDIDTRTDIYALGVLLYELLTGQTPFDAKDLMAAGLDAMRRTIQEREPARPSTRLSTMLEGELTTTAKHRHTDGPKLVHLVRGDLDWIVMKCLEKDRARRYDSANGLANDVKRHLSCEPVVARPPTRLYEFQKTVRRHKFGFAAAGAVGAALFIGLVVSLWLWGREKAAHRHALAAELAAESGRKAEAASRARAEMAERAATEELWHSYLAEARAARFSGQPGRRFDSLAALAKARAIRFAPELRDEAIACLALPDFKLQRRIEVKWGGFDRTLERYAAVLTNLGQVSICRTSDDHELFRLPNPPEAGEPFINQSFSHNSKLLPVWYDDTTLRVWDVERRAIVLTVPMPSRLWVSVDFQPDDKQLAVPGRGEVGIYQPSTGQKVTSFPTPFDPHYVRFDPSGQKIAISSESDHRVPILDASSGALLLSLESTEGLNEVAWHPSSRMIAAAGQETGLIYVWDTGSGRQLFALKGHQSTPGSVAFSPDGDLLMSSGWDGTHLWHTRTGEHLMSYRGYGGLESFGPGGGAYGHSRNGGGLLELLSFAAGREARRWHSSEEDRDPKIIEFSSDGRWLAFGAGGGVELFDARTSELVATLPTGPCLGIGFQRNGGGLLVSGMRGLFRWPIRPVDEADELSIGPAQSIGQPGVWEQASLSENGQVFAAFHGDHVCLFDGDTLQDLAQSGPCGRQGQYRVVSISPDGRLLATGGHHDQGVKIWEAHTGALVKELAEPEWKPDAQPWPAFEPAGRSLIITTWFNYRVWDTNSWTAGPRFPRSDLNIMALSHQGGLAATSADGQTSIQLRDIPSGEVLATLQSPIPGHFTALAFSPDDTQIAVAHWGTRELLVWDLRLLREQLKSMGLDWARPPYAPEDGQLRQSVHFRVLTNSLTARE